MIVLYTNGQQGLDLIRKHMDWVFGRQKRRPPGHMILQLIVTWCVYVCVPVCCNLRALLGNMASCLHLLLKLRVRYVRYPSVNAIMGPGLGVPGGMLGPTRHPYTQTGSPVWVWCPA